jgi:hypothetical protein
MATNGVFPVDFTTDVGRVRMLVPDTTTDDGTSDTDYLFSDDYIQAALDLEGGSVKRAAAALIDVLANDQALLYKSLRTDDLTVNGVAVAQELRQRARSLRGEADRDEAEYFEIVYDDNGFIPEGTPSQWGRGWMWTQWH